MIREIRVALEKLAHKVLRVNKESKAKKVILVLPVLKVNRATLAKQVLKVYKVHKETLVQPVMALKVFLIVTPEQHHRLHLVHQV